MEDDGTKGDSVEWKQGREEPLAEEQRKTSKRTM